jgi:hypothetical protein
VSKEVPVEKIGEEMWAIVQRVNTASLEEPLKAILPILDDGFMNNFARAEGSAGGPWPERKDSERHPLLNKSGALLSATQAGQPGNITEIGPRELATGVNKSIDIGGIPGATTYRNGNSCTRRTIRSIEWWTSLPTRHFPPSSFFRRKET